MLNNDETLDKTLGISDNLDVTIEIPETELDTAQILR
jgi:hypothetical protein